MLPSKAKTVFNASHLASNSCFLSSDVDKIHVSYVICIILSKLQASKHATLQYKVLFLSLMAVRMIKTPHKRMQCVLCKALRYTFNRMDKNVSYVTEVLNKLQMRKTIRI